MSWREEIVSKLDSLVAAVRVLNARAAVNSKQIGEMKVVLEQVEKTRSRAADRMADRIVEMAMVNQGMGREAAAHRRSLDESTEKEGDPWQDSPETQWPPPGTDEVHMP